MKQRWRATPEWEGGRVGAWEHGKCWRKMVAGWKSMGDTKEKYFTGNDPLRPLWPWLGRYGRGGVNGTGEATLVYRERVRVAGARPVGPWSWEREEKKNRMSESEELVGIQFEKQWNNKRYFKQTTNEWINKTFRIYLFRREKRYCENRSHENMTQWAYESVGLNIYEIDITFVSLLGINFQ